MRMLSSYYVLMYCRYYIIVFDFIHLFYFFLAAYAFQHQKFGKKHFNRVSNDISQI